ncbi:AMP-binding enzyme [Coniochaeta hoffmannii]|uniref:AMP-binding enzyme n=1 Tax=Coniochaeta hoffmannii TaxID=91930 RepID=A0AA38VHM9_9PEZI|nr:AMP-binding enzyme [Coniochaeta hoffmannii]
MKIYKADKTISIPRDQNLTELLHSSAYPTLPESHLIAKDNLTNRSITIGELRERAGRIAKGLHDEFRPVDQARWAVVLPNSVEYLEIFQAVLWTGGVACPINYALRPAEIGHALAVSKPHFVVVYGPTASALLEGVDLATKDLAEAGIKWQRPAIVTMISRAAGFKHIPDDFYGADRLPVPHYVDTSKRLASIHLSSGTTGKPKGVELTHLNFIANCHQLVAHDPKQFGPDSKTIAFTPWAHIAGTTAPLFLGPYCGMLHHAMPQYSLEKLGELAGSDHATNFQGPPSVVLALANSDVTSRYDFSHARTIMVGGAPLKKDLVDRLLGRAPWRLRQVYGMTEAAGYVAYQKLDEELPDGVVGKLLPNIEARLVKEGSTEDVAVGEAGELWLRGPNITRGYAFDKEATGKAFPVPGWYNTGDVCKIDDQGRISVVGRTKELIKYKGFQVAPAELESYLNSHPHVAEGGVAATWDESQLTELPTAWVVLKDHIKGESETRKALVDIHQSIDEKVSGYKKLRGGVWHVPALPKNPTGKILRKVMAEMRQGLSSLEHKITSKL